MKHLDNCIVLHININQHIFSIFYLCPILYILLSMRTTETTGGKACLTESICSPYCSSRDLPLLNVLTFNTKPHLLGRLYC